MEFVAEICRWKTGRMRGRGIAIATAFHDEVTGGVVAPRDSRFPKGLIRHRRHAKH